MYSRNNHLFHPSIKIDSFLWLIVQAADRVRRINLQPDLAKAFLTCK